MTTRLATVAFPLLLALCIAGARAEDAPELPPPPVSDTVKAIVRVHAGARFGDSACADLGDSPA